MSPPLTHLWLFCFGLLTLPCDLLVCGSPADCNRTISLNAIRAFGGIIREHFVPNSREFIITFHAKSRSTRYKMDELLSCILPYVVHITVAIETLGGVRAPTNARKYNLLLIDGVEALEDLHPAALTLDYDINEYYLVCLIDPDPLHAEQLITSILRYFWRHFLINVSLLHERSSERVELYTYFPFLRDRDCKQNNVLMINSFSDSKWRFNSAKYIFPEKLADLQGCVLKVAVWDTPPYLSYRPDAQALDQLSDFEGELLLELAKKLNFSMQLLVPPNDEQRGKRLPNGTLTGAMKMLHSGAADLSLGCFRYTMERCEVLTAALPYFQTWQSIGLLLTARSYTSLEILSFAFDRNTWFCLVVSLQLILLFTYAVHRQSRHSPLAHVMIGMPRPRTPLTDILGIFVGVSVPHVPRTNFARFVLVMWLIYGYVMRTAYQSLLYQLLQTELYRAPPTTLDGLIAENYALIMTEGTRDTVDTVPYIHNGRIRVVLSNETAEQKIYEVVEDKERRLAGVSPQDYLTYYVKQHKRRGIFYVLPEKIFAQQITMYFTKHSFLIERFNELLMQLRSHGLIEHWASKYLETSYFHHQEIQSEDPLEMDDLLGVFLIYFVLINVTILVFFGELCWYRVNGVAGQVLYLH